MLGWIIQIISISFLFILLVHHLICFFKNTLTIPKIKDLVRSTNKKYDNIYQVINENSKDNNNSVDSSYIDLLPVSNSTNYMKDELKFFLKEQLNFENEHSSKLI